VDVTSDILVAILLQLHDLVYVGNQSLMLSFIHASFLCSFLSVTSDLLCPSLLACSCTIGHAATLLVNAALMASQRQQGM